MQSDLFGGIFILVLIALFVPAVFFFYVLFYRGIRLKRKLKEIFHDFLLTNELSDVSFSKSPYMYHEGGTIIEHIALSSDEQILIYQFIVSGQLNMRRYLVHIQSGLVLQDAFYGKGHIYRECKAHNVYKVFRPIGDLSENIDYLNDLVEAIEISKGTAYCYYKLNQFIGSAPIQELHSMAQKNKR